MKVLITAPSLDENDNVSGISTMINSIIEHGTCEYEHFVAGRKDGGKFDIGWITTQVRLPLAFRGAISRFAPDVVHINTAFEPRAIIRDYLLASCAGKRRVLLHVHGGRFVMEEFPNAMIASLAEKLVHRATRVVALGDAEASSLSRLAPASKISVLPNAIAAAKFPDVERKWETKNIVYLGRLEQAKGLSDMVEASRLLVGQGFKFRFTCYGTGRDQETFINSMTSVIGDNFTYGGVVAGDAKLRALNEADIFLMPSQSEGLPMALLEAMAAGCVPIVSDRGSIPSVVEDGRNGFLVEPGDLTQIVGRLKFLLSEGERGWDEYRSNARETIHSRFDIRDYVRKLSDLYTETLAAR